METNTENQPAINSVHTNAEPSLSQQSTAQEQPAINKIDRDEEPLTPENNPGGERTNKEEEPLSQNF